MACDHGVGAITGASIDQNNSGTFNIIDPGPGTYAVSGRSSIVKWCTRILASADAMMI